MESPLSGARCVAARRAWLVHSLLAVALLAALPAAGGGLAGIEILDSTAGSSVSGNADLDGSGGFGGPGEFEEASGDEEASIAIGGTNAAATSSQSASLSADASVLSVSTRVSCESHVASGDSPGKADSGAATSVDFRVGSAGSFQISGTASGAPAGDGGTSRVELIDPSFDRPVSVVANSVGSPATLPVNASGPLEAGDYILSVSCTGNAVNFPANAAFKPSAEGLADITFTATAGEAPPPGDCDGDVMIWAGGRAGAFGDPGSWQPPQVPTFEEDGPCDTALVRGVRNAAIDLGAVAFSRDAGPLAPEGPRGGGVALKAGRLLVYDTKAHTSGGTLALDALSPERGARSLEVGDGATLFVTSGRVVARHVELGAEGSGELDVGLSGSFENTGRLAVGATGPGRLLVRQGGQATSAEAVLGEVDEPGSAVVEDAESVWTTGSLAVGLQYSAELEILDGARVESEVSYVDFELEGDESASVTVRGTDSLGNRATWSPENLHVRPRGSLSIGAGGAVEVGDGLFQAFEPSEGNVVSVADGGLLSAARASIGGTLILHRNALALVTGTVALGQLTLPSSEGQLFVQGPAAAAQLDGADLLTIEARGSARLAQGARVGLFGPFEVGIHPDSDALLRVVAGQDGAGEPSVLHAAVTGSLSSAVGAASDAPLGVDVAPTGRVVLEGGRIELVGSGHELRIERRGILAGRGGTISIEPPGLLSNQGLIEGGFTLDGSYQQGPRGYVIGQIRRPDGALVGRSALSPLAAAGFPRRAVRGKPAPAVGPLVVTGDAVLDGGLALQFGNGVAPRAGDSFEVLDVRGSVTGSFSEISIRGLVPGSFAFEPSLAGGKLALVSTLDAVALPAVSVKAKKRLKETAKKGGKIKLKRTGDTSAALVVSYRVRGTAQSGVDYEALPGTIEIPARKKSATIVVKPLADGLVEGAETIEFELVPGDSFAPGVVSSTEIDLVSKDR